MLLQENIPLAPLTTFRSEGLPVFSSRPRRRRKWKRPSAWRTRDLPLFVLGGGSNLVVADSGWPGLVLKIAIPGIERRAGHGRRQRFCSMLALENPGIASSRMQSWRTVPESNA